MRKRLSSRIRRWITRANELNPFQGNPRLISGSIKPSVFDQLAQKRDDTLGTSKKTYSSEINQYLVRYFALPYLSISGKLISSQNKTIHLPNWVGAKTTPFGVRLYSQ